MSRIVAAVVLDSQQVTGGIPIFLADNAEEQLKITFTLEKIMNASAHDLKNGTYILVDHSH